MFWEEPWLIFLHFGKDEVPSWPLCLFPSFGRDWGNGGGDTGKALANLFALATASVITDKGLAILTRESKGGFSFLMNRSKRVASSITAAEEF